MTSCLPRKFAILAAAGACALPLAAAAQSIGYEPVSGSPASGGIGSGDSAATDAPAEPAGDSRRARGSRGGRGPGNYGVKVSPYIEAAQLFSKELSPGDDALTYTALAAGVDASIQGRNNGASVSLRYEHRFGWGRRAEDSDTISGVANGYATVVPGVTLHAGALAARSRLENSGAAALSPFDTGGDRVTQIYSVYAGPSVATHAGAVAVNADYRIGYNRVESPDAVVTGPGATPVDVFDDSVVQLASVHAGVAPGTVLPIGLGAGAKLYQEDVSNLDQRIRDFSARADVTVPLTNTLAAVGGIGYEDVEVSSRDAVRVAGEPVIGPDGRYVTDKGSPRLLAYDVSGLIWDAGVIWRPSRRTALEAHVGRRYGSTTYYGSFAYAPNARSAFNVSVYDNVSGFGGQVSRALDALPTDFEVVRNPLSGGFNGCVSSLEGGNCLSSALGSVRSSAFRARGVMANYSVNLGRLSAGVGGGYDRRKFIGAPGTVLAGSSGVIEENWWLAGFVGQRLDEHSGIRADVRANWFQSGSSLAGDATLIGASASYYRNLTRRLSANAAIGIDGIDRDAPLTDQWIASALLGLRYSF